MLFIYNSLLKNLSFTHSTHTHITPNIIRFEIIILLPLTKEHTIPLFALSCVISASDCALTPSDSLHWFFSCSLSCLCVWCVMCMCVCENFIVQILYISKKQKASFHTLTMSSTILTNLSFSLFSFKHSACFRVISSSCFRDSSSNSNCIFLISDCLLQIYIFFLKNILVLVHKFNI